jgi:hypothetical protein
LAFETGWRGPFYPRGKFFAQGVTAREHMANYLTDAR